MSTWYQTALAQGIPLTVEELADCVLVKFHWRSVPLLVRMFRQNTFVLPVRPVNVHLTVKSYQGDYKGDIYSEDFMSDDLPISELFERLDDKNFDICPYPITLNFPGVTQWVIIDEMPQYDMEQFEFTSTKASTIIRAGPYDVNRSELEALLNASGADVYVFVDRLAKVIHNDSQLVMAIRGADPLIYFKKGSIGEYLPVNKYTVDHILTREKALEMARDFPTNGTF